MKQNRHNLGFTMVEMIAVVAMLIIVSGLIFVGVAQYQRGMYQKEMDGYAKELYVAAQNHLSIANSQDLMRGAARGDDSTWTDDSGKKDSDEKIYYYVVQPNDPLLQAGSARNDLRLMLPLGSIDDTLRLSGSYVIRYQYDPDQDIAAVLDVFYANPNGGFLFANFGHTFVASEYGGLAGYAGDGDDASDARAHYPDGGQAVIGWYGGDQDGIGAVVDSDELKVEVENAERLVAWVSEPSEYNGGLTSNEVTLELFVRGETSGAAKFISLAGFPEETGTVNGVSVTGIRYVLDDITESGQHFTNLFPVEEGFLPGENLELRVYATPNVSALADGKLPIPTASKPVHTNSLFDSVVTVADDDADLPGATKQVALVSNIRHLENLSDVISGFNPIAEKLPDAYNANASAYSTPKSNVLSDWLEFAPTSAQQTVDLALIEPTDPANPDDRSWLGFMKKISDNTGDTEEQDELARESVRVYDVFGDESGASPAGSILPVNPGYPLNYDGLGHRIWGIVAQTEGEGPSGLFGKVSNGKLSNLELVNFDIAAANGNAGALAGELEGTEVVGVLARNQADSADEGELRVAGSGNVGGLVGSLNGGSIDRCAAAVIVRSTGGVAGGLVGDAGSVPITNSYSGGHTVDGAYDAENFNVQAGGVAGGLVGITSGTIANCYSTCSAKGSTAGGLVGSSSNSITNCYALGLVAGATANEEGRAYETAGALAGSATGTLADCRYLEIVNAPVVSTKELPVGPIAGRQEAAGASAIDATVRTFNDFAQLGTADAAEASPYDGTLVRNHTVKGKVQYMYRSIVGLNKLVDAGYALPEDDNVFQVHMEIHFGDWPSPESLVINP